MLQRLLGKLQLFHKVSRVSEQVGWVISKDKPVVQIP